MDLRETDPVPDPAPWDSPDRPRHRDPKENPQSVRGASQWPPKAQCPGCGSRPASARALPARLQFVGPPTLSFFCRPHQLHTADGFCPPNPLPNSTVAISHPPVLSIANYISCERKVPLISVLDGTTFYRTFAPFFCWSGQSASDPRQGLNPMVLIQQTHEIGLHKIIHVRSTCNRLNIRNPSTSLRKGCASRLCHLNCGIPGSIKGAPAVSLPVQLRLLRVLSGFSACCQSVRCGTVEHFGGFH